MPLGNIQDREFQKFVESPTRANGSAVEVVGDITTSPGPFAPPSNTDSFTVSYPNSVTEVYEFRSGGVTGTIIKSITLIYANSSKQNLLSGVIS
jgi:hypothetical protein